MIKFWIIDVTNKSIIFEREFPINIVRAKQFGFNFKNWQDEKLQNKTFFVDSILNEIGFVTTSLIPKNEKNDLNNLEKLENYDFSKINTLPIINLKLSENNFVWPLIIIEQSKTLYCGLPLIKNSSKKLIDHLCISKAFTTLKALVDLKIKETNLNNLELFINNYLPFGELILYPKKSILDPLLYKNKKNEPYILFQITEYISSGSKEDEAIYGTLIIENFKKFDEINVLKLNFKDMLQLNLILSSYYKKKKNENKFDLYVNLNETGAKILYYFCDTNLFKPFFTYDYVVTRSPNQNCQYKIELTLDINIKRNNTFNNLNIVFLNCFGDKTAKLINSLVNCGLLSLEKNGLTWFVGNKLPKNNQLKLTLEVTSFKTDMSFTEANIIFQTNNFNYGFPKITSENIIISDLNFKPKFIFKYNFTTLNYKLQPTFE